MQQISKNNPQPEMNLSFNPRRLCTLPEFRTCLSKSAKSWHFLNFWTFKISDITLQHSSFLSWLFNSIFRIIYEAEKETLQINQIAKYTQGLKTLFNIVEAPFNKILEFFVCVVWWCSDGPINSQEYKSFEIYGVTIKSLSRYLWLNRLILWGLTTE